MNQPYTILIKENCCSSINLEQVYRSTLINSTEKTGHLPVKECYRCSNFYLTKYRYEKHVINYLSIPGFSYSFDTENLETSERNIFTKTDIPFVTYYDFEITNIGHFDFENDQVFPVSYIFIFAFQPDLHYDRIFMQIHYGIFC